LAIIRNKTQVYDITDRKVNRGMIVYLLKYML